ncbi:UDP-glucose 4-epimerase GalE [Rhizobium cremeum]|uniref:UDP-glucose 4-epimerase GalE n=1 Tax=Rhizobium cremeum TaxID=2813827 RepID=UPI000DE01CEE|nr:UDP-glucose 4-epimerase GalE [Rhizobium cremeum]MCJ7994940.1 UDP-glucose 4-epimerase GalE [Rhizobium cremeum]MCJ8000748.1 UDP-glucose 4-epimerase GalE [Rhizobium cremeum]
MAILVTGGAGYIGSHMVWSLLDAGEDVVVIDRLSTGFRWAVAPAARFYLGDVGDDKVLTQIFAENDIEAIIHFAGSVVVPDSVADPLGYYDNNTGNTRILLSAAVRAGIDKFIFSSTAAVYGTPDAPVPVVETAPLRPENPYGQSKLMSEIMLKDTARAHDFRYVALRYFNVAGADLLARTGQSTVRSTHLIKVACEAALGKRRSVEVFGTDYATTDGTGVRDYIHVSDLVLAHLNALDYLRRGGATLTANCGYGKGYSVLDVLRTVQKVADAPISIEYRPRREGDAAFVVADATLARSTLGWVPRHDDLKTIVATTLDWERRLSHDETPDIEGLRRRLAASSF